MNADQRATFTPGMMAINGVRAEVRSGLKRIRDDVEYGIGELSSKPDSIKRIDRLITLLADIPKIKKPLEEIVDELAKLPTTENSNATALLEECLANGDEGAPGLYAWFLAEREGIEATIADLKEGEQS